MSDLKLHKFTNIRNEGANSDFNKQENPHSATDMDLVEQKETVTRGLIAEDKSKDFLCIDIENGIESPADKNKEIEIEKLVYVAGLKINIISQKARWPKFTVRGLYEYMVGTGQQQGQFPSRLTRQIWHRKQLPPESPQTVWTQYDPSPVQPNRQGQAYPQVQANPQGHGYPQGQGYLSGQGYPQGQGYPGYSYPPSQGYPPGQGYPQDQGFAPRYPEGQGRDGGYPGAYGYDEEGPRPLLYDPGSRNSFVRLVMGIVLVMLLATAGFLGFVLATPEWKHFFQVVGWMVLLPALVGLISANCAMICSPCARRPPCNFICLIITTASMSLLAAKITSHYRTEIILYAVIATTAVVFVCVVLAFSKFDFTSYLLYIIAIATAFSVIVMIILITMMVTGTMMKPLILTILIIGTLIQIVMLTMELQMILGGKTIEISESDYALAAFMIYTSILDIFLKLVHILGLTNN